MCYWLVFCTEYILPYTSMFYSGQQIKGGESAFLLAVPTTLLFDSCPILYSASSPHTRPHRNTRICTVPTVYRITHASRWVGSTYLHPHSYTHTHGQKNNCFFLLFFHFIWMLLNWYIFISIVEALICIVCVYSLCLPSTHKHTHRSTSE